MKTKNHPSPETTTSSAEANTELQEQIRARAYELYEQRGGESGHELDDWLQAEDEVLDTKSPSEAA
jgi:hypothetical protein